MLCVAAETAGFLSYKGFMRAIRQLPVAAIEAELKFKLDDDKLIRVRQASDIHRLRCSKRTA